MPDFNPVMRNFGRHVDPDDLPTMARFCLERSAGRTTVGERGLAFKISRDPGSSTYSERIRLLKLFQKLAVGT